MSLASSPDRSSSAILSRISPRDPALEFRDRLDRVFHLRPFLVRCAHRVLLSAAQMGDFSKRVSL
jgi:hypothetical protein